MGTRRAVMDDFDAIFALLSEFHSSKLEPEKVRELVKFVLDSEHRSIILAIDDVTGEVFGTATVNLVSRLAKLECRIDEVVVSERARGRGYGVVLMNACEQWAWEHGADFMELTTRPSREAANHLYQKVGFEIYETNVYIKNRT